MLKKYPIIRVNWQLSFFSWAKKPSDNILFEMITWLKIYHLSSAPHHNPSLAVCGPYATYQPSKLPTLL